MEDRQGIHLQDASAPQLFLTNSVLNLTSDHVPRQEVHKTKKENIK